MRRATLLIAFLLVAAACGIADPDDTSTTVTTAPTTTTTTAPPSTTTTAATPSALSSGDYCTTYIEWIDISEDYVERYEDPTDLPEFQDFTRNAFRALAELAPSELKSDWEYIRDFYESDPTAEGFLDEDDEARDNRIIDYAIENCPDF